MNEIEKILSDNALEPSEALKTKILAKCIDVKRTKSSSFISKKIIAVILSVLVLITSALGGVRLYYEDYTNVYIDINPSIKLVLNRFDIINDVVFLNDEAKVLFSSIDIEDKKLDEGIVVIMKVLDENGYLENGDIYVSSTSEEVSNDIVECINKYNQKHNHQNSVNKEDYTYEERQEAHQNGLSPSKYYMIQDIIELEDSYTFDMLKDKSMKELRQIKESIIKRGPKF